MKHFDKKVIDKARNIFHAVYVDKETPEMYIGNKHGYDGDRIRIYETDWEYEEAIIFTEESALEAYMEEYEMMELDGIAAI